MSGFLQRSSLVKGILAFAIVGMVVSGFIGGMSMQGQHAASYRVNHETLPAHKIERMMQAQQPELMAHPELAQYLRQQITDALIQKMIRRQAIESMGFHVPPSQIDKTIFELPLFQEEGRFSMERFHQFLSHHHLSEKMFRELLQESAVLQDFEQVILASSLVGPWDLQHYLSVFEQTRDIRYKIIPHHDFKKKIQPSEEDIALYYQEHQKQYRTPQKADVEFVQLKLADMIQDMEVSFSDVEAFYAENQDLYATPDQMKIAQIVITKDATRAIPASSVAQKVQDDLVRGQSFAKCARLYSEDSVSAQKGGDMGWIALQDWDPLLAHAAETLTEDGAFSGPIETPEAILFLKRLAVKKGHQQSFDEVKDDIVRRLKLERAEVRFAQSLHKLEELAYENPHALEPIVESLGLTIEKPGVIAQGQGEGIARYPHVEQAIFSKDVYEEGENSRPIPITDDWIVVVRVQERFPAQALSLEEAREQVIAQIRQERSVELAYEQAQEVLAAYQSEPHVASSWPLKTSLKRVHKDIDGRLLEAAFKLYKPREAQLVKLFTHDYAVVVLEDIHDGDKQDFEAEELERITENLRAEYGYADLVSLMNQSLKEARIRKTS